MQKVLFSTHSYTYLKTEILALNSSFEDGNINIKRFPDGEVYHQITSEISKKHAIIIGGTIDDANTLELYDIAIACEQLGVSKLSLIMPYFGYSTMERAVQYGEIVKAKTRALLFSSIPQTPFGNDIYLFDLHTEGLPYYFEKNCRTIHVYCKDIIKTAAHEFGKNDFVLASTDAGRAKWVESLANDMHVNAAFVFKRRISGAETQITSISADVKDKLVIIYDDMIRTGGSLIQAAMAYKNAGAKDIAVITTHGLFIQNAIQKLKESKIISAVYATNSHPNCIPIQDEFLKVKSMANLIIAQINE
jgi:ribose-phosphate pyrophosphokinase